jgi:hypothetical protein
LAKRAYYYHHHHHHHHLLCYSPRWVAGGNRSPTAIEKQLVGWRSEIKALMNDRMVMITYTFKARLESWSNARQRQTKDNGKS